jgi:WD40 repeat protein
VTALAFDCSRSRAVSGDYAGTIYIWDVNGGQWMRRILAHDGPVTALAISADGVSLLSAGADRTLRVWQTDSGTCTALLEGHAAAVLCADLTGDGEWAVSVAANGEARMWNLGTARPAAAFQLTDTGLESASASLAAGSISAIEVGGALLLWDIERELEV